MQTTDLKPGQVAIVESGKLVQRVETECGSVLAFIGSPEVLDPGRFWSEPLECSVLSGNLVFKDAS